MKQVSTMHFARWMATDELSAAEGCFIEDTPDLPDTLGQVSVATGSGDEARVGELLARGAARVLVGDLALRDSAAVERLAGLHGADRIGIWVRAVRGEISWTLAEKAPNAGFKCMQPSIGQPGWDVLMTDGSATGTDAEWWIGQMLGKGISMALISVDLQDEDMNICATLLLEHGAALWFSPLHEPDADLEPWVHWGQVRQLVLPLRDTRDEAELARIAATAVALVKEQDEDGGAAQDDGLQIGADTDGAIDKLARSSAALPSEALS